MSFEWYNVNIEALNNNKRITDKYIDLVKNASGHLHEGQMLAIMGPSGGGKTTLLNALAGRVPKHSYTQGTVLYNKQDRVKEEWIKMTGFVDQDDVINEDLTIVETLRYAGRFRTLLRGKELDERVEQVLNDLQLMHVSRNEMRTVSGGERKRTMIGIELIADPKILFLDEPTSGLDTLTALKICRILKKLTCEGKIVVLSIHQPSLEIFYLFDQLLLLSQGNSIFYGKVKSVESFFNQRGMFKRENTTIPEFIVEVCSEDFKIDNPSFFYCEESIFDDNLVVKDMMIRKRKNDFYINALPNKEHIKVLLQRRYRIESNKKGQIFKLFFTKAVLYSVVFMGTLLFSKITANFLPIDINNLSGEMKKLYQDYFKINGKCLVCGFTASYIMFMQTSSTITAFFNEIGIVRREIAVESYSTASYVISLLIHYVIFESLIPILYIIPLMFTDLFDLRFFAIYAFTALFSVPYGIFIGSISSNKSVVMVLSSIFGTITGFQPSTICSMLNLLQKSKNLGFLIRISYLLTFITPYYYTSFIPYLAYKNAYHTFKGTPLESLGQTFKDSMVQSQSYIGLHQMHGFIHFLLMIGSPFICIMLAVYFMGRNVMPEIRMLLEKKYSDKTK